MADGRDTGADVVLITAPLAVLGPEITSNTAFLEKTGLPTDEALVAEHRRYDQAVRQVATDLDVPLVDSSKHLEALGLESFFTRYDLVHPDGRGRGHVAIAQELAQVIPRARE